MATLVRPLRAADLDEADRIFRLAFGTFLRLPEPRAFAGDAEYVRGRFAADPLGAFAAEHDGAFAGSVFATCWGRVGLFGPLSVHPDFWGRGVAQRLLAPVMTRFAEVGVTHAGLFTFADSAKHVGLYGTFGFAPRFLTVVAAKPVAPVASPPSSTYGALDGGARARARAACLAITTTLYEGLDLGAEIEATVALGRGDVVLLGDASAPEGFAVCHVGAGTEAGGDACYVKFGAVPCGPEAEPRFARLLDACERFAAAAGVTRLVAGVNLARDRAAAALRARGFRTVLQGVAMHRPNAPGYARPDVFALDDWR